VSIPDAAASPLPSLDALPADEEEEFGAKAVVLSRLRRRGHPVPPGFCIGAGALDAAFRDAVPEPVADPVRGPELLAQLRRRALEVSERARRTPLPRTLREALRRAYVSLVAGDAEPRVAVRSSAPGEDSGSASFAGQHHTALEVRGMRALEEAVQDGWASSFGAAALAYRLRRGIPGRPRMALLVQPMIDCDAAGVLFTVAPLASGTDGMLVELVRGHGARLVEGRGADERWTLARSGPALREPPERGSRILPAAGLDALRELALRVEADLGAPQDIEWGWTRRDGFQLLQARPITVVAPPPVSRSSQSMASRTP